MLFTVKNSQGKSVEIFNQKNNHYKEIQMKAWPQNNMKLLRFYHNKSYHHRK